MTELYQLGGFILSLVGAIGFSWWRWSDAIGKVKEDLSEHKLHVSETYATKAGLSEQMVSVTKAITDMSERIDKRLDTMTDRLDRVIEANHKPVRRQG